MTDYIVPALLFLICALALKKGENAYDLLLTGAADGLRLLVSIVPSLVLLLTAVTMKRLCWYWYGPSAAAPPWRWVRN